MIFNMTMILTTQKPATSVLEPPVHIMWQPRKSKFPVLWDSFLVESVNVSAIENNLIFH